MKGREGNKRENEARSSTFLRLVSWIKGQTEEWWRTQEARKEGKY